MYKAYYGKPIDKIIFGWFNFQRLYSEIVKNAKDNSHFVEIGACQGMSSAFMVIEIINSKKNINFDIIDLWKDENYFHLFKENMKNVMDKITVRKMDSVAASLLYEDNSLDFVFVDGDHTYEGVSGDLNGWYPKIKTGGIFAGHDYYHPKFPGISKAVNEFFGNKKLLVENYSPDCWYHQKS